MKRVVLISFMFVKLVASLPLLEDFHKAEEISHLYEKPLVVIHKLDFLGGDKLFESEVGNEFVFVSEEEFDCDIPIAILFDKEGREITRLGCEEGTAEEFAKILKRRFSTYQKLSFDYEKECTEKELEDLYQISNELGSKYYKERILDRGCYVGKGVFFLLEKYASYVNQGERNSLQAQSIREIIQKRDPNNEQGSKLRLLLLDFQEGEIEPIQEYMNQYEKDNKELFSKIELLVSMKRVSNETL